MTRIVPAGIDRRALLKSSVAASAALATVAMPAIAQTRPIKLGYISPQTGPLAAFAEADNFIIANFKEATKAGIKLGNATVPVEVVVKDSQSNPNRAAQVAKDLIVQDKIDLMLVASTPETTNPVSNAMRDRRGAVHLDGSALAALVHWPPGRSGRRASCMEEFQLHLPLLLGARRRYRGLYEHVEPGADQQISWRSFSE
jgi:hypothetical protein